MTYDNEIADESPGYEFDPEHVHSADENYRRFAIIHISHNRLHQYEPTLLTLLGSEPSEGVRRGPFHKRGAPWMISS
jgi:hypothetical protein